MKQSQLDDFLLQLKIFFNFKVNFLLEGMLNILCFFKMIVIE
jgi:hypothetical protein